MPQIRLIKPDGTDVTYHGASGISVTRDRPAGKIIVRWKPDAPSPPFMEKHIPDDADVIYVMNDHGGTTNTYKLNAARPSVGDLDGDRLDGDRRGVGTTSQGEVSSHA